MNNDNLFLASIILKMPKYDIEKKVIELANGFYFWDEINKKRLIIDSQCYFLLKEDSTSFDDLYRAFQEGERSNLNELSNESVENNFFVSYKDKNLEELKQLIKSKIVDLQKMLDEHSNQMKKNNLGFRFWTMKNIIYNIEMVIDKILRTYSWELSETEINYYQNIKRRIVEGHKTWKDENDIEDIIRGL